MEYVESDLRRYMTGKSSIDVNCLTDEQAKLIFYNSVCAL